MNVRSQSRNTETKTTEGFKFSEVIQTSNIYQNVNSLDIKASNIQMSFYQMFSKGVRLLALHIEYQPTGLEMRKSEMKCQIDPPHELWS